MIKSQQGGCQDSLATCAVVRVPGSQFFPLWEPREVGISPACVVLMEMFQLVVFKDYFSRQRTAL